jgi:ABC-type multidrug transport system ATPase subunit
MNTVTVRGATKGYGKGRKEVKVLTGLNMTVSQGSMYGNKNQAIGKSESMSVLN